MSASMLTNATVYPLSESTFGIGDYIVFAIFLCISGAVGIFFSIRGQKTTNDYFYGGKKMGPVPVGISAGVSFLSAQSLIGAPAEVYVNGYTYLLATFAGVSGYFVGSIIVGSTFQPLGITSVNEYLARRFDSKLLTYTANLIVLLCIFQYMGVCMLGSVIALNSVTGGEVSVVVALIIGGAVGVFYTSIGGLKAVVWTDVIQSLIMVGGVITIIVKSIMDTPGGVPEIWRLNREYGRIHAPDWSFDLTIRHTFWGLMIGYFVSWGIWCVQPAGVQRLCSVRTTKDSYIIATIASSIFIFFNILPGLAGMNVFAFYARRGCDVHAAGWVKSNEILLYFIRERVNFPGFKGFFVAALYAGSLSSLSSGLNSASAILWKDTIKPLLNVEVSEIKATLISKVIVVVFGVLSMCWCYTLYIIGGLIIQMSISINASIFGAYFGMFFLPIFFRYVHNRGVFTGSVVSLVLTLGLGINVLLNGNERTSNILTTTENCAFVTTNATLNSTLPVTAAVGGRTEAKSFLMLLSSISYEWLNVTCVVIALVVSLAVTGCTGGYRMKRSDENLLFCACRRGYWSKMRCSKCHRWSGSQSVSQGDEEMDKLAKSETDCSTQI